LTLDGWWSSLNVSNVSDPHVLYDPFRQRWIFTALGDRVNPLGLLLAVSQTNDPTANWYRYYVSLIDETGAPLVGESPTVGFNTNRIIVQVNLDDNATNFTPYASTVLAFNKANLYAGGST